MIVAETPPRLHEALGQGRPRAVALVPTMGALHAGHAALMSVARSRGDLVVLSIFVNPLQFAPGEDLSRYPRNFDADLAMCQRYGVDVVFAPGPDAVYPSGEPLVTVEPGPAAQTLEGITRPGHFRGVLTVVAKLFGLVQPSLAVFGEKDYQQLTLVRQMVRDLCMPVDVVAAETVRDPDGLALSSRNAYLSSAERGLALSLSRALQVGQAAGEEGPAGALRAAQSVLDAEPELDADYLALRAPDLGDPPLAGPARLLVAARVGTTRLIDNVPVELGAATRVDASTSHPPTAKTTPTVTA